MAPPLWSFTRNARIRSALLNVKRKGRESRMQKIWRLCFVCDGRAAPHAGRTLRDPPSVHAQRTTSRTLTRADMHMYMHKARYCTSDCHSPQ